MSCTGDKRFPARASALSDTGSCLNHQHLRLFQPLPRSLSLRSFLLAVNSHRDSPAEERRNAADSNRCGAVSSEGLSRHANWRNRPVRWCFSWRTWPTSPRPSRRTAWSLTTSSKPTTCLRTATWRRSRRRCWPSLAWWVSQWMLAGKWS